MPKEWATSKDKKACAIDGTQKNLLVPVFCR